MLFHNSVFDFVPNISIIKLVPNFSPNPVLNTILTKMQIKSLKIILDSASDTIQALIWISCHVIANKAY